MGWGGVLGAGEVLNYCFSVVRKVGQLTTHTHTHKYIHCSTDETRRTDVHCNGHTNRYRDGDGGI